jgi:CP family cyanate transporter-like MFS transporter
MTATAIISIALTGATLRVAVTSVGAQLPAIRAALHLSGAATAWLTALPVLCFSGLGAATPFLARRVGPRGAMMASLLVSALGLVGRALTGSAWVFGLCSVLALAGAAAGNVLMPGLVRGHGAGHPGAATALYTSTLALASATAAAGTTALAAHAGWRGAIGAWGILDVAAACTWLPLRQSPKGSGPTVPEGSGPTMREGAGPAVLAARRSPPVMLARCRRPGQRRSPGPWSREVALIAAFFGFQSVQSYTVFGWFPTLLENAGTGAPEAGALIGLYAVIAVPVYLVAPRLPPPRLRIAVLALGLGQAGAYLGLIADPVGLAWLWMTLAGMGSGAFAVALRLVADAGARAGSTTSVSAAVQGSGYLLAAAGPLLVGLVRDMTGSWVPCLGLLAAAAVISTSSGLGSLRQAGGPGHSGGLRQERPGDGRVNLDSRSELPT